MGLDVYAVRPSQSRVSDSAAFQQLQSMLPEERGEFGWLHPDDLEPFGELPREFAQGGLFWPSDGVRGFLERLVEWLGRSDPASRAVITRRGRPVHGASHRSRTTRRG